MKIEILKLKDKTDKYTKKKKIFDLSFRLLIISKTGMGKTNILSNLLLRSGNAFYRKDFKADNIYIFSGSLEGDFKVKTICEELEVEKTNCFNHYDNDLVNAVYDNIVEDYNDAMDNEEKPYHSLIVFDDLNFDNSMRGAEGDSAINRIFMNGRKFLVSVIVIGQKYGGNGGLSNAIRENADGLILGKATKKQIELIELDHNYIVGKNSKKDFIDMYLNNTEGKRDFLVINYSKDSIYFNKNFVPIKK